MCSQLNVTSLWGQGLQDGREDKADEHHVSMWYRSTSEVKQQKDKKKREKARHMLLCSSAMLLCYCACVLHCSMQCY